MPSPRVGVQIVNEVAAAHDEDAFVAQRRETLADVVVKIRRLHFVDAELHHWNSGVGHHMTEHRPRPVIESPMFVGFDHSGREERLDLRGELAIARRGVSHFVKRPRESAEIVDRAGTLHGGHESSRQIPMRGNANDRLRPRHALADRAPASRVGIVLDRVHRVAVAEENRRHSHQTATVECARRSTSAIARATWRSRFSLLRTLPTTSSINAQVTLEGW